MLMKMLLRKKNAVNADIMEYDTVKTEMLERILEVCSRQASLQNDAEPYCRNKNILMKCKQEEIDSSEKMAGLFLELAGKDKCLELLDSVKLSEECRRLSEELGEGQVDFTGLEKICQKMQ